MENQFNNMDYEKTNKLKAKLIKENLYNINVLNTIKDINSKDLCYYISQINSTKEKAYPEHIDIVYTLIKKLKTNNDILPIIEIALLNNNLTLVNKIQQEFKIEIAIPNKPNSLLNNNLKKDKKILTNTKCLFFLKKSYFDYKNITEIIKEIHPNASRKIIKLMNEIMSDEYTYLIDLSYMHTLLFLSKIFKSSEKIEDLVSNKDIFKKINNLELKKMLLQINPILSLLSDNKKNLVLKSLLESIYWEVNLKDLINEYALLSSTDVQINPKKINSFHDIHSYISHLYRKIQKNGENIIFQHSKLFTNIENINNLNIPQSNLKLELPKDKFELINWGEKLNNCLASYNDKILDKSCIILGVFLNKEIKYALELNPETLDIVQFVSSNNSPVNKSLLYSTQALIKSIARHNPIIKTNYNKKFNFKLKEIPCNEDILFEFGFLEVKNGKSLLPKSLEIFNVKLLKKEILLINNNIYANKTLNKINNIKKIPAIDIYNLEEYIRNSNNHVFLVDLNKLYKKNSKSKYKQDISHLDLCMLQEICKTNNCSIIIRHDLKEKYINEYSNLVNSSLKIIKQHITDDILYVTSYKSINNSNEFIFKIREDLLNA